MARRRSFPRPTSSTTARGYGSTHQAERKRWEPLVESGHAVCVRCRLPIMPGTRWHLDHDDDKIHYDWNAEKDQELDDSQRSELVYAAIMASANLETKFTCAVVDALEHGGVEPYGLGGVSI